MLPPAHPAPAPDEAAVLCKAVVRAGAQLGLRQAQTARMLGLSASSMSRLTAGRWQIPPNGKSWELAAAFVRLYRSLSAITGGQPQAMRDWLHSYNAAFQDVPANCMLQTEGLIHVVHYLDAARARL